MQITEQTLQPAHPSAPATAASGTAMPDGFVKVEGGASEQVSETTSLVAAYTAIWLILMAFTLVTFKALRLLRAQAQRADAAVRQLAHTPR
jgi:hypothetical protein